MIGGLMKSASRLALVAAAGLFVAGSANIAKAADLGGNCCADLEERVAELEATTVRKGNRKVSVTLSGQVNRALLYWNDGSESGVYSIDNTQSSTRMRLRGSAKIAAMWSAGFYMEWETVGAPGNAVNQIDSRGGAGTGNTLNGRLGLRQANWWIKHDQLGTLSVGRLNIATKDLSLIELGGISAASYSLQLNGLGMFVRPVGRTGVEGLSTVTLGNFFPPMDTNRAEGVRYDSPTIAGFTLSAAWADDDRWDVALRYAGEFSGVRIAGGIGYFHDGWEQATTAAVLGTRGSRDQNALIATLSILHVPTGLFVSGQYFNTSFDGSGDIRAGVATPFGTKRPDATWYWLSAGIRKNWFGIGDTSLFGEYGRGEDGNTGLALALPGAGQSLAEITSSSVEMWGLGIVQHINAADMELYLSYRHYDLDVRGVTAAAPATVVGRPLESFDFVMAGARIKF
ncbi:MAG: porin [Hyphomicrobiaceae bacterium]